MGRSLGKLCQDSATSIAQYGKMAAGRYKEGNMRRKWVGGGVAFGWADGTRVGTDVRGKEQSRYYCVSLSVCGKWHSAGIPRRSNGMINVANLHLSSVWFIGDIKGY